MDEAHHIGILLNGSGLAKVAQLRTLALFSLTVLYTTVQLRQGDNGNVQLLGQPLQRTRNRTHLFLTAAERHAAGIHQLKVVDDNHLYPMLANQTAGLGTKFEYGKRGSIIHVQRRIQQVAQLIVQLLPFVIGKLSAFDFLTRYLAHVGDETVHQLYVAHFKGEQGYGIAEVHGDVLRHGEHERRLTHGRTGGYDNEVGVLPAGSHLVQFRKSALKTAQTVGTGGGFLNKVVRFGNDRIDLRIVLLHVLLRNLEELAFGFLHQVVHIERLVERLGLYVTGEGYQLARQRLLGNDTGVILDMRRGCHLAAELGDVERAAHLFQISALGKLLLHGENVHRFLIDGKVCDSGVYQLMPVFVKRFGTENFAHQRISVFLDHQCTQYGLFQFRRLRLDTPVIVDRLG